MMGAIYWLLLSVLLIGIELATMGLTTIWFAGGAFAAFIMAELDFGLVAQLVVFIIISLVLLIFTRPIAARFMNRRTVSTNVDSLIGKSAVVTEDIDNVLERGAASVGGQIWTARSADEGVTYVQGEQVEIVSISGVKLLVRKNYQ